MGNKKETGLVIEREAQLIRVLTEGGEIYRGIPLGKIRKKEKVFAGDRISGRAIDKENFAIEEILPRKNLLSRPRISNVDKAIIVMTIKEPEFQNYLLDNLLVLYESQEVDSVIVFNKIDLLKTEEEKKELEKWVGLYQKIGYPVFAISALEEIGLEEVVKYLEGQICVFAGPSGVGKSFILSKLTGVSLKSGEVSHKTGRGRHTSRGVKLIPFGKGAFVADSPGFSKVEAKEFIDKKEIKNYFIEFNQDECLFRNCLHIKEKGCEVKEAVKRGEIPCERYKSYLKMLEVFLEEEEMPC